MRMTAWVRRPQLELHVEVLLRFVVVVLLRGARLGQLEVVLHLDSAVAVPTHAAGSSLIGHLFTSLFHSYY